MGGIGGAGGSVDSMAAVEPKLTSSFQKKNKKGMWEASEDPYWPTFHSYWHDKDMILCLHFFVVLPSGCCAEDVKVTISHQKDQHHLQVARVPF